MEWYLGTDMLIAYLVFTVSVIGLLAGRYGYNPKLRDMEDSHIMDAIDTFGIMMSNIYSLPPIKIVIEDLSAEIAVYSDDHLYACFIPNDKDGSRIIIDLERVKRDAHDLKEICSVVIHEYTHYHDCSLFDNYKDWLRDYESNPWHYELRSGQAEKDYTKTLMKKYCTLVKHQNQK